MISNLFFSITLFVENGIYEKWLESYKAYLASKVNKKEKAQSSEQVTVDSYGLSEMRSCFAILKCGFLAALIAFLHETCILNRSLRDIGKLFIFVLQLLKRFKSHFGTLLQYFSCLVSCCQDLCSDTDDDNNPQSRDFFDRAV